MPLRPSEIPKACSEFMDSSIMQGQACNYPAYGAKEQDVGSPQPNGNTETAENDGPRYSDINLLLDQILNITDPVGTQ